MPSVLASVCRRWRSIVLAQQRLWCVLILSDADPAHKARQWRLRSRDSIVELVVKKALGRKIFGYKDHEPGAVELRRQVMETLHEMDWTKLRI